MRTHQSKSYPCIICKKRNSKYGLKLIDHHYQYAETPYANPKKDFNKIKKDIVLSFLGKRNQIKSSVPFPGSMITAVWKKLE